MQKITKRPQKQSAQKKVKAARNRAAKAARRKSQRKLKQKLSRLVDIVGMGGYQGVKESPLLQANMGLVMRMLKQRGGF